MNFLISILRALSTNGVANLSAARGPPQKCCTFHLSNLLTRI